MIRVDPDVFQLAQEDHGGWSDDMPEVGMNSSIYSDHAKWPLYIQREVAFLKYVCNYP